jgi:2-epi-5-epi-valiolone 7-kinase
MHSDSAEAPTVVFDIGGTWFRWGLYYPTRGLMGCERAPSINYLSHPTSSAAELQAALVDFILEWVHRIRRSSQHDLRTVSISLGAPVNAHDGMVLGSGPLWGETATPFHLQAHLRGVLPDLEWCVLNDITALLAPYMDDGPGYRKTMMITVSSGVGSRLYDHRTRRIPYDPTHGIQGEIGHLVSFFEVDGKRVIRRCECGGWNHLNAFSSGRGITQTLRNLPTLMSNYGTAFPDSPDAWQQSEDEYRLCAFKSQLDRANGAAHELLDALVTPLAHILAAALALDPEIERIVMTGGVVHGLGAHYKEALQRSFAREGLYQITDRDPHYLARRLHWHDTDDFAGLRGAGVYAEKTRMSARASTPPHVGGDPQPREVVALADTRN